MTEPAAPPPEEKVQRQSFDTVAVATMQAAAVAVLSQHPEVRSVVVVLDYHGELNEAKVNRALWIGENGPVTSLPALFGSVNVTLRTLDFMFRRISETEQNLRERAQVLGAEVVKRQKELNAIPTPPSPVPAAPGPAGPPNACRHCGSNNIDNYEQCRACTRPAYRIDSHCSGSCCRNPDPAPRVCKNCSGTNISPEGQCNTCHNLDYRTNPAPFPDVFTAVPATDRGDFCKHCGSTDLEDGTCKNCGRAANYGNEECVCGNCRNAINPHDDACPSCGGIHFVPDPAGVRCTRCNYRPRLLPAAQRGPG